MSIPIPKEDNETESLNYGSETSGQDTLHSYLNQEEEWLKQENINKTMNTHTDNESLEQ